ncbi:hypothetical protein [Methylobacterium sp. Leaf93]|uniref:hypothetical protein n=1 Tax=Methylobacterium sp. Leaf93 TaxID=1736249 RepID=UPI000AFEFA76|nr:hypothetical protein [Methylobacterium sp. Leaf93]
MRALNLMGGVVILLWIFVTIPAWADGRPASPFVWFLALITAAASAWRCFRDALER